MLDANSIFNMNNNSIEIPLSKTKLAKLLLFSILFLIAGIWMIIVNPTTSNPVFNNPALKIIAAVVAVLLGSAGIFFFTRKLFDKKPGLIINEDGIYDNTSAFKFGFIPWSDISMIYDHEIKISALSKQRFITIGLNHPEKYISREARTMKRKLLEANAKNFGSPVHLSTNGLKINHKELFQLIQSYFQQNKQHG